MSGTGRELYIYYRVRDADAALARESVGAMQRSLCAAHPGLAARRLRRPGSADGMQTWMETYARPGTGVDAEVEAAIAGAAASLRGCIAGERHVEVFVVADPP